MSIEQAILDLQSMCRQLDEHPEYLVSNVRKTNIGHVFKVAFYREKPFTFYGWVSHPAISVTLLGRDDEGNGWEYAVDCAGEIKDVIDHIKKAAAI